MIYEIYIILFKLYLILREAFSRYFWLCNIKVKINKKYRCFKKSLLN